MEMKKVFALLMEEDVCITEKAGDREVSRTDE